MLAVYFMKCFAAVNFPHHLCPHRPLRNSLRRVVLAVLRGGQVLLPLKVAPIHPSVTAAFHLQSWRDSDCQKWELKVSTVPSYNPTSYSINAYTFMTNTTFNRSFLSLICVVIWIYFLCYSPVTRKNLTKKVTALVPGGKVVQLSMPFYQHSATIYLRSRSYLVDNISSDIVTENWCQVCVPTMMSLCRSDCQLW